jgi:hypothetical protein
MNTLNDILHEQRMRREEERRNKFLITLALDGSLPITSEDIDFASHLTRNELFVLAMAASARARQSAPPVEEEKMR